MRLFKQNKKGGVCSSAAKEQALYKLAKLDPKRMAEAYTRILGQFEEYDKFNSRAQAAIDKDREDLYLDANFMRNNALFLAMSEINKISECVYRRFGVNLGIPKTEEPEEKVEYILTFLQMYYKAECQNVACFK